MNNTSTEHKPWPKDAVDTLPEGYVILGWGGDFEVECNFTGVAFCPDAEWNWAWDEGNWVGHGRCILYAASKDSEIVKLNHPWASSQIHDEIRQFEESRKTIYIAGPMRGKPHFNFAAFDAARDKLSSEGWNVISPADIDREHGFDALTLPKSHDWNDCASIGIAQEECFDRDIAAIRKSDAVYMLKGWQGSKGATAEHACAVWLGLEVIYEEESICEEAYRIQGGDRQQDYGDPTENFQDIATLWNDYIFVAKGQDGQMEARDIAHMMILMKIARNCHKPKRDNAVDMAGYAQCLGKIDKV